MSLVVWLPLNGNLENQGLSNVTVTNNRATVDNNGKIGKCYSFGSSKRITVSQPANLSTTAASLSCWVNLSAWGSSYDSLVNLSTGTGWSDTRLAFVRNNTANRIGFCVANGSTYNFTVMTSDLPLNTWTHLTGTFDGSTIKIYVNGVLNNSAATTFNSLVYGSAVLNLGSWSNGNNYPITGKLNDVRVYSHCLAAKEVKELSKGLVLHYRLSGPGQENLIKNSQLKTEWAIGDIQRCNNPTGYNFNNGCLTITSGTAGNANNGYGILLRTSDISYVAGEKLTFSVDIKGTGQHIGLWFLGSDGNWWTGTNFHIYFTQYNNWTRISVTGTVPNNAPRVMLGLHAGLSNNTLYAKNIKLERGSVPTPWCPNPADALYSAMGYNNNIEYDCSGYLRNGTQNGNFTWSADSPRYATSYLKTSNSKPLINVPTVFVSGASIPEITMACWWKSDSTTSADRKNLISLGENNFIRFGPNSSTTEWIYCTGTTATITIPNCMDMKWHHHVITFKGGVFSVYFDGELKGTQATSLSAIACSSTTNYIGAYFSNSEIVPGAFSDARVYATALSADDIAELYHSAVIVDNTGKNYAYEYFEAN